MAKIATLTKKKIQSSYSHQHCKVIMRIENSSLSAHTESKHYSVKCVKWACVNIVSTIARVVGYQK